MEKWKKSEFQNTCVKIEHVTKRFGEDLVLKEVNLTLKVGQVYGVVGNNGSGKTVLMKCICGFLPVTTGTIRVFGKEIGRDVDFPESLGVIIETPGFLTQYTGVKNLEILADMKRMISKADIRLILKKVGLDPDMKKPVGKYSLGMRQRLGIAQAIIGNPKVIIVDEPTTGLDPEERIRFRNILSEVSDKDVIIILSTHIVGDISSTCKKLALLNKGELKFEGSPDDMIELAQGKVWEIFVTDPELQQIKEKYPIISTIPSEGGWEIQIVTEKLEGFDGKAIIPNIEHAYVYFMDYLLKDKMEMYSEKIGGDLFN